MSRKQEFEGKDLQEALNNASAKLGIAEPDLDYEILEQGRRGLFGVGARAVRIRIIPPVEPLPPLKIDAGQLLGQPAQRPARSGPPQRPPARRDKAAREGEPQGQPADRPPRSRGERGRGRGRGRDRRRRGGVSAPGNAARHETAPLIPLSGEAAELERTFRRMIDLMQLNVSVQGGGRENSANVVLELGGPDHKRLTRKDGELLSALQFLLNRMARRSWPSVGRIRLLVDGETPEREEDLVELAREVAQQVARTGEAKQLHPMNAYERRVVHLTVREFSDVGSSSEGSGAKKAVRIFKKAEQG